MNPSPNRVFQITVVAVAAMVAIVHVVSARPSHVWMWGAHMYAFYPGWVLVAATCVLAVVALVTTLRAPAVAGAVTNVLVATTTGRRFVVFASTCVLAGTALFWFARTTHTYLGDGNIIVEEIDRSRRLLEREPLSSLLQYAVYGTTKWWFFDPSRSIELNAQDALAPGSVAAGAFFLVMAWLVALELARMSKPDAGRHVCVITVLLWIVVVAQGYMQLFFGYVENYSFYAVGVLAYLWLTLRYLRAAAPLLLPALALVLCFSLHLSSLVLGASFGVLAVFALVRRETRRRALRDLAIALAVGVGVAFVFARVSEGYNPLATLLSMVQTAFASESNRGYMFSSAHYRDFTNEQILIGPLGMFLFLPAAAAALLTPGARRQPVTWFFLVAGMGFLAACWLIGDSNLGYARDWDLLSHSAIVFTTASLAFLLPRTRHAIVVAALVCAAVASMYHTAPWIGVNADAERSLARLQTLPLGLGRTEVVVSTYYRHRGDAANERMWLQRAIQRNPVNVNAIYLLGDLELDSGRYQEAVPMLEEAVRMRPDKLAFRISLVKALTALNRLPDAIPHLEVLARSNPQDVMVHVTLGEALRKAGRVTESREAFGNAERLYRPFAEMNTDNAQVSTLYGLMLLRIGRLDDAQRYLEKAIALEPRSADAYCFLGYVLRDLGEASAARNRFLTCLTINPGFADRGEIEAWLSQSRR